MQTLVTHMTFVLPYYIIEYSINWQLNNNLTSQQINKCFIKSQKSSSFILYVITVAFLWLCIHRFFPNPVCYFFIDSGIHVRLLVSWTTRFRTKNNPMTEGTYEGTSENGKMEHYDFRSQNLDTGCPILLGPLCFCYFLGFQSTYRGTFHSHWIAHKILISKLTLLSILREKLTKLQHKT